MITCPTDDEMTAATLALLPRGRAWSTHEGGPEPDTVLYKFWRGVALPFAFLHRRICALALEFFCASQSETYDQWLEEYGLPDSCDAYPDLCSKVAAIGGTRCEYYAEIAARAGWSIECFSNDGACGGEAGCMEAGCDEPGFGLLPCQLGIRVILPMSPAFVSPRTPQPEAGLLEAGQILGCPVDIEPLKCLLERITRAHLQLIYVVSE